jgi:hypothetical protein
LAEAFGRLSKKRNKQQHVEIMEIPLAFAPKEDTGRQDIIHRATGNFFRQGSRRQAYSTARCAARRLVADRLLPEFLALRFAVVPLFGSLFSTLPASALDMSTQQSLALLRLRGV